MQQALVVQHGEELGPVGWHKGIVATVILQLRSYISIKVFSETSAVCRTRHSRLSPHHPSTQDNSSH
jgi:hypothetical protein